VARYERGSEEFIVPPMYSAKLSKENSGALDAVFWIDGSHRLQGGDDEFFGPPFVPFVNTCCGCT